MKPLKESCRKNTGAVRFEIKPICVYLVTGKNRVNDTGEETFGLLCFAQTTEFAKELHSEMDKVVLMDELPENWTYPLIQLKLIEKYLAIEMLDYTMIQSIAKQTIKYIKKKIKCGQNLLEIRRLCEEKMMELGADSFWYWDIGAFVFLGDETMVSIFGKQYSTSNRIIDNCDIITIDLSPQITGSKRGLDTRVSLKSALAAEGFADGTRGATELNQWIASEKQELATVMERYGVEWLQKGTHEKHLSVLEFEKKERAKEVAELDSQKKEISSVVTQHGKEVSVKKQELQNVTIEKELDEEAIQRANEERTTVQQEKEVLLASNQDLRMENSRLESRKDRLRMENHDLKQKQLQLQIDNEELEQRHEDLQYTNSELKNVNDQLAIDNYSLEQRNDTLQSDNQTLRQKYNDLQQNNVQLEKQQNELKHNIEQMVQSEQLLQRDVRKYDEAPEWQLPELGAFASAKSFRDKVEMPFVNKLKTLIKNLTIQCVKLKEEVLQLRKEKKRLSDDVEFYKGKIKNMSVKAELLQEKADDLERVKKYAGAEQIDTILRKVKEQECIEQQIRRYDRSYGMR